MKFRIASVLLFAIVAAACSQQEAPPAAVAETSSQPTPGPTFINRVWQVSESSAVAAGSLYVFLSEGTLVMASTTGTPSLGKWTQENGKLTMIEEGIAYPTDVLELSTDTFRIRSNSPGEPVEIAMTLAR